MSDRSQRFPASIAATAQGLALLLMVAIGLLARVKGPHSPALPKLQAMVQALRTIGTLSTTTHGRKIRN